MSQPHKQKRWSPGGRLKQWFIRPQSNRSQRRGDEAEAVFEEMTENLMKSGQLRWAQAITKASAHEDLIKGFDFRIRAIARNPGGSLSEFSLLINVKSSLDSALRFRHEKPADVYWVVAYPNMRPRELRNVLYSVYMREIKRLREAKLLA